MMILGPLVIIFGVTLVILVNLRNLKSYSRNKDPHEHQKNRTQHTTPRNE